MADTKITALTAITTVDPAVDVFPIVDVSDTTMAASGTTKKITSNQLLGAGGTATLASATITGDLTVDTSTLKVDSVNNRVGIGTASPTVALDVVGNGLFSTGLTVGTSASNNAISVVGPSSGSNAGAQIGIINGSTTTALIGNYSRVIGGAYNENLAFYSNGKEFVFYSGSELMRLNSTGLGVGISPSYKLDISGGMGRISSGSSTCDLFLVDTGTTSGYVRLRSESNAMKFITGNGISAMIDSSGNVGVGVTPSTLGSVYRSIELPRGVSLFGQTDAASLELSCNAYINSSFIWTYKTTDFATHYRQYSGTHQWHTAPSGTAGNAITFTQAMTLDASGYWYLGLTAQTYGTSRSVVGYTGTTLYGAAYKNSTSGNGTAVVFVSSANGLAGYIDTTNTTVNYASVSDYRLKEQVNPLTGGLARINALKPSIYKWKSDGSAGEGFLAHELAEVVPSAVTGEKDAVNEDGSIKPQGVDLSRVVPILVAAIQELSAEVNALKNA